MTPLLRKRLYALQQQAALTGPEASLLLVIALLLVVGLGVQHVQSTREPEPSPAFAALDAEVARGAALSVAEARAARSDGATVPAAELPAQATVVVEAAAAAVEAPRAEATAAGRSREAPASRLGPLRINVNTASARQLERLPGIGPALAARVVEYREAHGPFERAEDLMGVRGIGPRTVERLAPYVAVD